MVLLTTNGRRNQLASDPNYNATKYFPENLMATEMKKNKSKNEYADISRHVNNRYQQNTYV